MRWHRTPPSPNGASASPSRDGILGRRRAERLHGRGSSEVKRLFAPPSVPFAATSRVLGSRGGALVPKGEVGLLLAACLEQHVRRQPGGDGLLLVCARFSCPPVAAGQIFKVMVCIEDGLVETDGLRRPGCLRQKHFAANLCCKARAALLAHRWPCRSGLGVLSNGCCLFRTSSKTPPKPSSMPECNNSATSAPIARRSVQMQPII